MRKYGSQSSNLKLTFGYLIFILTFGIGFKLKIFFSCNFKLNLWKRAD